MHWPSRESADSDDASEASQPSSNGRAPEPLARPDPEVGPENPLTAGEADPSLALLPGAPTTSAIVEPPAPPAPLPPPPPITTHLPGPPRPALPPEPDWYAVLGVDHSATQEEIAIAYRRRAAAVFNRRLGGARATRNLKLLNAAYEVLGQPDRRRDYDFRRAAWLAAHSQEDFPVLSESKKRKRIGPAPMDRPRLFNARREPDSMGALLIVLVVAALAAAGIVLSSAIQGFAPFTSLAAQVSLISPRQEVVAEREGEMQPLDTSSPLRFATPGEQGGQVAEAAPASAAEAGDSFAGSEASVSDPNPPVGGNVTVRLKLVHNGEPLAGVPVYAIAHFRTIPNERWPRGDGAVPTNTEGIAEIEQNIGNATPGYEVTVDLVATIDGEPHTWTTAFTPR